MPGDGIAARVGRILDRLPLPQSVSVRVAHALDWECVEAIVECDHLVVVDAMLSGQEPGMCQVEEVSPDHPPTFLFQCRHRRMAKEIVDLSELLAMEGAAKRLVFLGVEIGGTQGEDAFAPATPEVFLPLVVDSVLLAFGAEVALRGLVGEAVRRQGMEEGTEPRWAWGLRGAA